MEPTIIFADIGIHAAMASFQILDNIIPQLQTCTALILSAANCTEGSCSSNVGCNF